MRKEKEVTVGRHTVTVRELPVRKVWEFFNGGQDGKSAKQKAEELLKVCCPEFTEEVALDGYFSEIGDVWRAFEEVNSDFLAIIRLLGLDRAILEHVRAEVKMEVKTSTKQFASSSKTDTVQ